MTTFICQSVGRLISNARLSLLGLALASGVVFSHSVLAVESSPTPSDTNAAATHHSTTTEHHPAAATHHKFRGTITAVSSTSLTIVKKKTGESHTFQLTPETIVSMSQHAQGTLSNLAVGQNVQIQASPDDSKALHIHIRKNSHEKHSDQVEAKEHPQVDHDMASHLRNGVAVPPSDKKDHTEPATN